MRDIDHIINAVSDRIPFLAVRQYFPGSSSEDAGIWWFSLPNVKGDVQVESSSGTCPFLIDTDEQCSNEGLRASSIDDAARLIIAYLTAASEDTQPIVLAGDRFWP